LHYHDSRISSREGSGKESLRHLLDHLLAPIENPLEQVKIIYRDSLLSTGASQVPEDVLLDKSAGEVDPATFPHELVSDIADYMTRQEGKWLRPALVLLMAKACGDRTGEAAPIAAALELIHNATLIHDDIIDDSATRRGRRAVWKRWGSSATVLMGDLLYAKAFELTTRHGSLQIQRIIAEATGNMCQGELHQLQSAGRMNVTEEEYLQVVANKTACLMAACTRCGALIGKAPEEAAEAAGRFGLSLGMAFQIIDDVLDFVADPSILGKSVGNDVARGKVTLPLIHYMNTSADPQPVMELIGGNNGKLSIDLRAEVESTGSIDYARRMALRYEQQAQQRLDELSEYCEDREVTGRLKDLARFVVDRRF
jgi:octaprenyl-diphosphate synthase